MKNLAALIAISTIGLTETLAQPKLDQVVAQDATGSKLAAVPAEVQLAGGSLRIVNLYKIEASVIREGHNRPSAEILDQLVRDAYIPFTAFWQGYLGDETEFRKWAAKSLLGGDQPIRTLLPAVLDLPLDELFRQSSAWLTQVSGRRPRGTWYIVFGPGWTNMGGMGDLDMVLDFTRQAPDRNAIEFALPHELTHQAHAARTADPQSDTVLGRIISEGLGCYAAWVFAGGRQSPAQSLEYTDGEWDAAVARESELAKAVSPILGSKLRREIDRVAARNQRLIDAGPAAAGYFLGFRIMQSYVGKHGAGSWTEVIDLPVADALSRSGYSFLQPQPVR